MISDTSAIRDFERAFASYSVWAGKSQGPLVEDRAQKVRLELFKLTRRLAKTKAELWAEVVGRGYAIRRRVRAELAAEYPAAAAVGAVPRLSLDEELKARIRSLRFLSVSFITKGWRTSGDGQNARYSARNRAKNEIGSALLRTSTGNEAPFVSLTSFLEGVVEQNRRRGLTDRALVNQAADMAAYMARQHRKKLSKLFSENYAAAISV